MGKEISKKFKIFKTAALVFSWICMGLYSEVSSPTLPNLKQRVNSNYEEISRALVARSIGFLLGSLCAGVIGSKWQRFTDFWIALALFMAGGATIVAPWCQTLALLSAMFFMDGLGKGIQCVCTSSAVMYLWKEKAAVPTHALHFSFGIGALLAPQIARPFLSKKQRALSIVSPNTTVYGGVSPTEGSPSYYILQNTTERSYEEHLASDRIEIVYSIMGGVTLLCALSFVYFQIATPKPNEDKNQREHRMTEVSEKHCCNRVSTTCRENLNKTLLALYLILFVFWSLPTGAERAYGKFLFAFAVESDIQMAPQTATLLESMFWATFTAGRGIATIAARWTPPQVLLAVEIFVKLVCAFILAFCANTNATVLWVVTGVFGATISPIFPACLVWTNKYIEMTAAMNAFAFLSSAFGAFMFSWGTGYFFEYKGPVYLMYIMLAYALMTSAAYVVLSLFYRFSGLGNRAPKEEAKACELENLKEKA